MNVYVRDLSRELARRGHQIDVYTRSQDRAIRKISGALGYGARVFHLPAGPERPYDKNRVYDHLSEFSDGVVAQAEREGAGYDVLHSHYWLSGVVARGLRDRWGTPMMHMFHTLGKKKDSVAQRPEQLEEERRISVESEIVRDADVLVASTRVERDQLVQLYGADQTRIRVISPGVDIELFRPMPADYAKQRIGICPDRRVILFVGRIDPLKGIDTLLRAMADIIQQWPELRHRLCVPIIGGDPDRAWGDEEMARLQSLKVELGIDDIVLFLGARDQDELQYYYSAADVVVVPSDYESFGMVALEAMACGTPVIASDVGGLATLVRNGRTGYRVPARDPAALAAKIKRLLTDEGLRRRIGQRASCRAEEYAWPRIADKMEKVYAELAGSSMEERA
ncbi:MAG: glycosyltransferase family 1 protein [Anaerolineales bacterium]|nr:MAG: glycosyltransferase family 1 protein [Anaerolineales bacterium]